MAPLSSSPAPVSDISKPKGTKKVTAQDEITYVRCDSSDPFENSHNLTAEDVNAGLNLNLGMPLVNPNNSLLRRILSFLNWFLISWWEHYLFVAWNALPVPFKRKLTFSLWHLYLPLHKLLLGRSTAIHKDASAEYHALTTIMWWGRLFPVSVQRMRFALSQLSVWMRDEMESTTHRLHHEMNNVPNVPKVQADHMVVRGAYISVQDEPTEQVIFWLYGGAFLSGCVDGNLGPAEYVGRKCGKDVFLPQYRLLPEHSFDDMLWDTALAYSYLTKVRGIKPSNIILFGISSGAGLCCRLMQFMGELQRKETPLEPVYMSSILDASIMPGGAVLMCPFVDYTEPEGTFAHYQAHDLIVNQSVTELGFPYFEIALGNDAQRKRASPVYRSFAGLPPLCVVVSEHEVVYDQTVKLVNGARKEGVTVSLGCWKYMCHVFCFLGAFIPEGEQSMAFVCDWMIDEFKNKKE